MAKSVLINKLNSIVGSIKNINFFRSSIIESNISVSFTSEPQKLRSAKTNNYSNARLSYEKINSRAFEVLPFRVRFINIGIESYGPNNPPPIGIAVIGFNNYIL